MQQTNNRSVTPPPKVYTKYRYSLIDTINLKPNEFPIYENDGTRKCPPAPPPHTKEMRVCNSCRLIYQIVLKTSPDTKCGNCETN